MKSIAESIKSINEGGFYKNVGVPDIKAIEKLVEDYFASNKACVAILPDGTEVLFESRKNLYAYSKELMKNTILSIVNDVDTYIDNEEELNIIYTQDEIRRIIKTAKSSEYSLKHTIDGPRLFFGKRDKYGVTLSSARLKLPDGQKTYEYRKADKTSVKFSMPEDMVVFLKTFCNCK